MRIIDWSSDVCSSDLYDDEPADIVALDMAASAGLADPLPAWRSATTPSCGVHMVAPGAVALEAAAITVPVLVAVGERDVVPDPWMEPKAFKSARSEEHTSELQSLMRISYSVFCLKKKK